MKPTTLSTLSTTTALLASASATAQMGYNSAFGGMPACLSSCASTITAAGCSSYTDYSCLCSSSAAVAGVNACIAASGCSEGDKMNTYKALAQLCANAGTTLTASPEATFSVTSGGSAWPSSYPSSYSSYPSSYADAWSSYTASASAQGSTLSTRTSGVVSTPATTPNPTQNPYNNPNGNGGDYAHNGPFGPNANNNNGWGPWSGSSSWPAGPWTNWWGASPSSLSALASGRYGNGNCPAPTWSGWTSGAWATNAEWTAWEGCTARTTATSVGVVTSTVGGSATSTVAGSVGTSASTTAAGSATGSVTVLTTTSFGIQVAQVTGASSATGSAASSSASKASASSARSATGSAASAVASKAGAVGRGAGVAWAAVGGVGTVMVGVVGV
ncbi:hypothetical protein LTR66_000630 [Elasticomyces elasticus]|nr:hypothetical protein LTR66_000630 [Elasticomyces elasticus]KAK5004593.1 hypothetical protein LTR28_008696 [Elasticomyces elasticus]